MRKYCNFRGNKSGINPNVAKAEGAVDPRRRRVKAVVIYAEPLATQEMQYHRVSRRVNNMAIFSLFLDVTRSEFHKIVQISRGERLLLLFTIFCHVVYATKG